MLRTSWTGHLSFTFMPTAVADPVPLLQELIRFDTTNPPGNEAACLAHLRDRLSAAGISSRLLGGHPDRPNLVARVEGRGEAPPLLLQAHVDVVTTVGQEWAQPPFEGRLLDGYVWGRGALDQKSGVAMMAAALLQLAEEGRKPPGDVVFCALADEEAGGVHGAQFLVERHPELFEGIRHGLGEGGGSVIYFGGRRFYTLMVAEKRSCRLRATFRGPGGHASRPLRGTAMGRLGRALVGLEQNRLPVHITAAARMLVEAISEALPGAGGEPFRRLLDPAQTDDVLDGLDPIHANRLDATLHNTVSPTLVQGGIKINVIPSQVSLDLDGRMLPGFEPDQFLAEVRQLIGTTTDLEILNQGPRMPEPELGPAFEMLRGVVEEADPGARVVPQLTTGATDARHFARLGIRTYGFLPKRMPPEFTGEETVHNADERVPAEAVRFGAGCIHQALLKYS